MSMRTGFAVGLTLLLAGCGGRDAAPPPSAATAPPSAIPSRLPPAPPPWAAEAGERDGRLIVVEEAIADTPEAALAAARRAAYAALAAYRGVRVQALFASVTAEVRRDDAQALVDRAVQATRVASDQLVARAVSGRREVLERPDGRVQAWVELSIALDDLLPERRLQALLAAPAGAARRAALADLARQWLAGDALQRALAPLAAEAAVADGGGAAELILLARCHYQLGDRTAARRALDAAAQIIEGEPPEVFAAFGTLESQLAAEADDARALAERVLALARTLAASGGLRARAEPDPGGARLTFILAGAPRRLVGLWLDDEELSPLPAAALGSEPLRGAFAARIGPGRGTLLILALPPEDPLAAQFAALPRLALAHPSAEALHAWRAALRELAARPAAEGAAIALGAR